MPVRTETGLFKRSLVRWRDSLGRLALLFSLTISCLLLALGSGLTATLIVERNVNLRSDPSTANDPIQLLEPPEELDLLEQGRTNDYYHVRTEDGEEGWVWYARVRILIDDTDPGPQPFTGPEAAPATSISQAWDKPPPNNSQFTSSTGQHCGPTGSGTDPENNRRKNRTDLPSSYHRVTFDAIADLDDDGFPRRRSAWSSQQQTAIARFEGVAVTVEGYLVALKVQGGEGTNCGMTGAANVDWHVALVEHSGDAEDGLDSCASVVHVVEDSLQRGGLRMVVGSSVVSSFEEPLPRVGPTL